MTMVDGVTTSLAPMLSDGTSIASLIDRERRAVSARVFTDPSVYRLELRRVFARAWIAVAHESEIPNVGDYVLRYIGEDPVIVVRAPTGAIKILLNVCSHRAMGVCRAEAGNARLFQCPYHGWQYDTEGRLVAVTAEQAMYDDGLDRSTLGLRTARCESCAGWIFGTWDVDAPSLEEFLGPIALYMRVAFDRTDGGLVVAGLPERWVLDANWKLAADQFAGDAYHTLILHRSMADLGYMAKGDPLAVLRGVNIGSRRGHHVRLVDLASGTTEGRVRRAADYRDALPGLTPEMMPQLEANLSPEELHIARTAPPSTGSVYPNVFWLATKTPPLDGRPSPGLVSFRIVVPRGPDKMEIMNWALRERDVPPAVGDASIRNAIQTFSISGIWEQDDSEAWVAIQRALRGVIGQERWLLYRSVGAPPTDEFPGRTLRGVARDDCQWSAWLAYFEMMGAGTADGD